ncbi:DUF3732 domain-containing protein [Streptomyces megasporus]|uniref:DUF3732 domain-containing protein n=1 Tax=Streptomyces megasporus TaxID=44060 RepID=UPI0004E27459|nr:DUF3732 domain-containing protein [Streptomyces megasporus]
MQLLALALYHRDGRRDPRVIRFRPGALNILTGESETGKSEVLDIVDYCLGRNHPNLPDEPIDRTVGWYALLVTFGSTRMVLARPRPVGASTSKAMMIIGDGTLDIPPAGQLRVDADTDAIRTELSARLGIEDFHFQPPAGAGRRAFHVSIAHAALLCFQKQNEIANQAALFHRQTEDGIAQAIKDTLPYFLGAAGPEQALRRHQLAESLRAQRAAQRQFDDAVRRQSGADARVAALVRLAESEGLLQNVPLVLDRQQIHYLLDRALETPAWPEEPSEALDRRQQLEEERRHLRERWQHLGDALTLVDRWHEQGHAFTGELHLQLDRLKTLELLGPQQDDHRADICPLCARPLDEPDAAVADIVRLTRDLTKELATAETLQPVREQHRSRLETEREAVKERLRVNAAALQELNASDERMRSLQDQRARIAFIQGRIAQERAAASDDGLDDVKRLQRALTLAHERVEELQALVDEDDVTAETERRLTDVAALMTRWARRLDLGQAAAADEVRISLTQLNVVLRRPNGRLSLKRIGSAKNWIGYHLVAHLALHTYFLQHRRPVPRFLMLDQPTQAFFPEKVRDASTVEDADWETVTKYFELLNDVAQGSEGGLQIIVCDHANLPDQWFQDAIVENWRPHGGRRNALIPMEWLEE